jgi:hypothetical protein
MSRTSRPAWWTSTCPAAGSAHHQLSAAFSARARENSCGEDPVDQSDRPSVLSTGLPSALPVASANIGAVVTAVRAMPSTGCRGSKPAASTTVDWASR